MVAAALAKQEDSEKSKKQEGSSVHIHDRNTVQDRSVCDPQAGPQPPARVKSRAARRLGDASPCTPHAANSSNFFRSNSDCMPVVLYCCKLANSYSLSTSGS